MRLALLFLISSFLCCPTVPNRENQAPNDLRTNEQITELVSKFKGTDEGKLFFKNHDEFLFRKSLSFLQYPKEFFASIERIPDLCTYFWTYQFYVHNNREVFQNFGLNDFFQFLHFNFSTVDRQNVPILTHLILVCDAAVFEEALTDIYSKLFEFHSGIFINDLKQRKNWRIIIDHLPAGDWRAFKAGISKLGSSAFELELKAYVASIEKNESRAKEH